MGRGYGGFFDVESGKMLSNTKLVDIETDGNKLVEIKKKVIRYILIIGNGFDIACGLKTKYIDFFNARDERKSGNYTKWDRVFDLAHDDLMDDAAFQWVDVENIISNVVSIVLDFDSYRSNLKFESEKSQHDFEQNIRKLFITGNEKIIMKLPLTCLMICKNLRGFLAVILRNKLSQMQKSIMKMQLC